MSFGPVGGGGSSHGHVRVPPEMAEAVAALESNEPIHKVGHVAFSYRPPEDRTPLSLATMLRAHRSALLRCTVAVIIEALTLQAGPLLTQIVIDHGVLPGRATIVLVGGGAYVVTLVLCGLMSGVRTQLSGRLAADVMTELRLKVFSQLQRQSLAFYTQEKDGVMMTRMTADIEALQQLIQEALGMFGVQILTMIVAASVMFVYSSLLAAITLVIVLPPLLALSVWFRRSSDRGYGRIRTLLADVLADLSESLHGSRTVTAHNRARHNILNHRNVLGRYQDANDTVATVNGIYAGGSQGIATLGQAALLLIGGEFVIHHHLTVGELGAFLLYLNTFFAPMQQITVLYSLYQQAGAAVVKLRELLLREPDVLEPVQPKLLPQLTGDVQLDRVTFGYDPTLPVLRDVNLKIAAGETVAFVGPTGAGKSTISKLLSRFYDPQLGAVRVDGVDLREVSLASLRRQIGVVPQEPYLFVGTIGHNIAFGRPDASETEIMRAAEMAGLGPLIARLPLGLDTLVQERGQSLAAGERQLLALARAFLIDPLVLVLDEATSNLDLRSEHRVESALDVLLENRTAILIAHRLSTAMRADRIAVVADGTISELGTHAELVAAGGRYAAMFATWEEQAPRHQPRNFQPPV